MFNDANNFINGITFFGSIESQVSNFNSNLSNKDKEILELKTTIASLEKGTSQIIMFGVYLVAVTILGISLQAIIASIQKIELIGNLTHEQRNRLFEISNKCPIHKVLTNKTKIISSLFKK